jgi:N-acetylmuramoyl-L-alanine amidase
MAQENVNFARVCIKPLRNIETMVFRLVAFIVLISAGLSFSSFQTDTPVLKTAGPRMIRTLVIDPGHGGHDAGARGKFSSEKEICLDVSLKLGKMIEKTFPDIRLLYTRTEDTYPALYQRSNLANSNKGDLFISVHVNSTRAIRKKELIGYKNTTVYVGKGKSRKKVTKRVPQYKYTTLPSTAKGTETYIWGAHKSEQKELAMIENAPIMAEDNYQANYGDVDLNSPEFVALSLLKTKQYFMRSATFAGFIQDEFVKVGRVDRDVRQRPIGIWVLQATAMPSVLIETGFISNPEEEEYLNSEEGQNELSECIVRALATYLKWLEQRQTDESTPTQTRIMPLRDPGHTQRFLEDIEKRERAGR